MAVAAFCQSKCNNLWTRGPTDLLHQAMFNINQWRIFPLRDGGCLWRVWRSESSQIRGSDIGQSLLVESGGHSKLIGGSDGWYYQKEILVKD